MTTPRTSVKWAGINANMIVVGDPATSFTTSMIKEDARAHGMCVCVYVSMQAYVRSGGVGAAGGMVIVGMIFKERYYQHPPSHNA